jgi:hypothetical protein
VAHTCNPGHSGGREQENHSSKPAQANSSQNSISKKKKITKKGAGGVAPSVDPEFKPQYQREKKKKINIITNNTDY